MKVGLLGGSFNPLHLGHIAIAKKAFLELDLDKVWFLPAGNPPHKTQEGMIDFKTRLKLISESLSSFNHFEVSALDNRKNNFSYSLELIKRLKSTYPDYHFFFLIGEDNVNDLKNWYKYRELLEEVQFVVFTRPGSDKKKWEELDYLDKLKFIRMKPFNVSSTKIKKRWKEGKSIKSLVPQPIYQYLLKNPSVFEGS
mgnify:CR=1 FL=1